MLTAEVLTTAAVTFPAAGGLRVHPHPDQLRFPPFPPGQGPNRFDDPEGRYSVRYVADTLYGCLIEVLARFTPNPATEDVLLGVDGLDDPAFTGRPDPTPDQGLADWLVQQQVGHLVLDEPPGRFIDAYHPALLGVLDTDPTVCAVLDDPGVRAALSVDPTAPPHLPTPLHLTVDLVRAAGEHGGRRVTQTLGRVLFTEPEPDLDGLAYGSRHDPAQRCWALRDHVSVAWPDTRPLDPAAPDHRAAVRAAAGYLHLADLFPPAWA